MASVEAAGQPRGRLHSRRLLIGVLIVVIFGAAATLFGWEIARWCRHIWETITTIPIGYLLAAIALITLQTTTTAYAWYAILRRAYAGVIWVQILACYAAAVALNFVLPANIGTLVMLLMFTTIIAAASFAGVLAGYVIQKVFYSAIGVAVYLYLFLNVTGSFSLQFGFIREHPVAAILLVAASAVLIYLVVRVLRSRIEHWWEEAKEGGQILTHPPDYLRGVLFPEVISWVAMLGVIAVFLAAYNIPVTFDVLMRVVAGNSVANMTSVTPGGAGVTQAFNVVSLKGVTSSSNATAYSVAQQLVTTAWSIIFAIVLLARAFGWSGGKDLVQQSYEEAREKRSEQSAARKAKRQARREARHGGPLSEEAEG